MKIAYIAETSLSNKSAYTQHVLKMCDAFSQNNNDLSLFLPNNKKEITFLSIKKKFLLNSKKKFKIYSVLNFKVKNFFSRSYFAFNVIKLIKEDKFDLILTRSFIASFFLSCFKIKHFLEIHSEIKSITKFLMIYLNFINSKYIIKLILISNALNKIYKIKRDKVLILHDGVDINNFKKRITLKQIKIATYVGSFYKGRGIEIIQELASKFKNIEFRLYGDKIDNLKKTSRNIKFLGHINYSKVPSVLSKSHVLLMPYANQVSVRAKNINTANYCSPLKMFDYLAAGKIIMSSKLDGICKILKHKKNAIIVDKYHKDNWIEELNNLLKNRYNIRKISKNSFDTAKKNTWNKRVIKIMDASRFQE